MMKKQLAHFMISLTVMLLTACSTRSVTAPTSVLTPAPLVNIPADDSPHKRAETEWWYYSGHLKDDTGKEYGFHYVIFQVQLPNFPAANIYHLAITDNAHATYVTDQREAFPTPSTVSTAGFNFEHEGWQISGNDGKDHLSATSKGYQLNLNLVASKPAILQGGNGLVDYGLIGKSFYYSRTRLTLTGTFGPNEKIRDVSGEAWFDHQWGNFRPTAIGWDWFAIQFDDGSDLMLTRVRDASNNPVVAYGTYVDVQGKSEVIPAEKFILTPLESWKSPSSGASYPTCWRVQVPDKSIDVNLVRIVQGSEFDATATTRNYYWEGEVKVTGSRTGTGFLEMTGYAQNLR